VVISLADTSHKPATLTVFKLAFIINSFSFPFGWIDPPRPKDASPANRETD
jgi:hypothetical protein